MKRTCKLSLSFLCFLICFLLSMSGIRARDEALAADIAPKILRFHVLANSDSAKDQALKLRVKDLLLEKIRDGAAAGQIAGKEELKAYILSESSTLEAAAEDFIHSFGYDYGVHVGIETCRFPVRTYGDMTFPAGMYEAVRVTIGNADINVVDHVLHYIFTINFRHSEEQKVTNDRMEELGVSLKKESE